MDKKSYLKKLEFNIDSLPKKDVQEIISDYKEYFEDGLLDGKTESEIIKELGDINYISSIIISEYYVENPTKVNNLNTFMKAIKALTVIGAGTFSLFIGVPIILSFILCYLSFYLVSVIFVLVPLALVIHLSIPNLPISFGTNILWQKILVTGILFLVGITLFYILEKGRKKIFNIVFKFLTKNINLKSFIGGNFIINKLG